MQSSDDLKSKLKILKFSKDQGGSYTKDKEGHVPISPRCHIMYDMIGPDFQVFLYKSKIVW